MFTTAVRSLSLAMFLSAACFADRADDLCTQAGVDGGLAVLLGTDTELAAQLQAKGCWLVHMLVPDAAALGAVQQDLRTRGVYTRVSAEQFSGGNLPYVNRLVNLLVAPAGMAAVPQSEVQRVLAPYGTALVGSGASQTKTTQPYPGTIDQWTHYLHSSGGNRVAGDNEVGEPVGTRWTSGPLWGRHHSYLAGLSAMVTSNGRLYSVVDEGSVARPDNPAAWKLVARNAFNGVLLWRKDIPSWHAMDRQFRTGPADLTRCLVADGDRIFVTPSYRSPVSMLDGATGSTLRTYPETNGTQEIVYRNGILYVVTGTERPEETSPTWTTGDLANQTSLMAVNAQTGAVLWEKDTGGFELVLPLTLAVTDAAMIVHTQTRLFCLDPLTGTQRWSIARQDFSVRPGWVTPTVVIVQDVVLVADQASMDPPSASDSVKFLAAPPNWLVWNTQANECWGRTGTLHALSIANGTQLWSAPCAAGFSAPVDVFHAGNLVWIGAVPSRDDADFTQGRDLHTGQVMRTLTTTDAFSQLHHSRCHRSVATEKHVITSRLGVELIGLDGSGNDRNSWVRGTCQFGVLPANGLTYAPPHTCACFPQAKLAGMWALGPTRSPWAALTDAQRLETLSPAPSGSPVYPTDWPTYRHDAARSGTTAARLDGPLQAGWEHRFGSRLSAPVVAKGVAYVAEVDPGRACQR